MPTETADDVLAAIDAHLAPVAPARPSLSPEPEFAPPGSAELALALGRVLEHLSPAPVDELIRPCGSPAAA